jgi:hypothetical protein
MMVDWMKPIETCDGREARLLTLDCPGEHPIVIANAVPGYERWGVSTFPNAGMAELRYRNKPVKREGWVNVSRLGGASNGDPLRYCSHVYGSEEQAIKRQRMVEGFLATIRIEWEEPA